VRGELIPLVRLHELFDVSSERGDVTEGLVIVVGTERERRGLMVDDLLGQQQVVIKNLDRRLQGIRGFSGSSILGDGLVGLILDVPGIFELASS
ncbi:MAG: chemotaxis protein CheW, partial [Nitrospinae bacterium]|nr:chemotaxis protein CheW [Nitrospinota bacterium]